MDRERKSVPSFEPESVAQACPDFDIISPMPESNRPQSAIA